MSNKGNSKAKSKAKAKTKTKSKENKIVVLIFSFILIVSLIAVGLAFLMNDNSNASNTAIHFSDLYTSTQGDKQVSEQIKSLDGQNVQIQGFMAEQSPVDNSFIYLVNAPYTVCPFCVIADSTKLEVISIYMADNSPLEFSTEPVKVAGKLEVQPMTDPFNYTTQFRIYATKVEKLDIQQQDKELNAYFDAINKDGAISMLQSSFINIYNSLSADYLSDKQVSLEDKYNQIKTNLDLLYIEDGINVMQGYLDYLSQIIPSNNDLNTLQKELIDIYSSNVKILKDIHSISSPIMAKQEVNQAEKEMWINSLTSLTEQNKNDYDRYTSWNNKLRQN